MACGEGRLAVSEQHVMQAGLEHSISDTRPHDTGCEMPLWQGSNGREETAYEEAAVPTGTLCS